MTNVKILFFGLFFSGVVAAAEHTSATSDMKPLEPSVRVESNTAATSAAAGVAGAAAAFGASKLVKKK